MRKHQRMSLLPSGMDGGKYNGQNAFSGSLPDWQRNAQATLAKSLERAVSPKAGMMAGDQYTTRTVTPENIVNDRNVNGARRGSAKSTTSVYDNLSASASPRSLRESELGSERRHNSATEDAYAEEAEAGRKTPSSRFRARPRTRTMDEPSGKRSSSAHVSRSRHRIGSVHSTAAPSFHDTESRNVSTMGSSPSPTVRPVPPLKSDSMKLGRRLKKRPSYPMSSVPTTNESAIAECPSIDSLLFPIATGNANKILLLMKTLCGRMRGEVEYQSTDGPWHAGLCYIDDIKGSLMFESDDRGPLNLIIILDLRGCQIKPVNVRERAKKCLEISNRALGYDIRLAPAVEEHFDLWLAALLCWQQIRSGAINSSSPRATPVSEPMQYSGPGPNNHQDANIIKVAKILLWDKGAPRSPTASVQRSSIRDMRWSSQSSWRKVSCILQDNGEFRLLTENDSTLLSVIQLSQLSRSAIQRLDKSVMDEDFCIAIFPQYTPTATELSIFRPVYIALESRVLYEVWFCLLRAFSVPEIYGPLVSNDALDGSEASGYLEASTRDLFRIEKSLSIRVIEAKLRKPSANSETASLSKSSMKSEPDANVGDYFAEVILDGEMRARTMTKFETRNPFWREDCEFQDLPAAVPKLSIVLKKLLHSDISTNASKSSAIHVSGELAEVVYGTVDIPLSKIARGKDLESWFPVLNEQEEPLGEMFVKVRLDELVVLLAKDYQEISELLHRFNSGLTVQISQAIPANLRNLSEIFMNIFQVSGHATEWLMALVEDEIDGVGKDMSTRQYRWSKRLNSKDSTASERVQAVRDMGKSLQGEANLLFRGNSLLTQSLDFHMRRLGKEYLIDILSEQVLRINTLNSDCEVDPSRMAQGEDINKNWSHLIALTVNVWDAINLSASRCPPEMRQILKYIRAVTEDRYGGYLRTVTYTSVSGFLFLRFFCPALLNPKLFGLLQDHPQPRAQRTLTLVAKSLQALANLSTFGQKELWMEPMNKFLHSHRQALKDYIDAVCSLPSERSTFALPASYSTPITILARLPPTSREGFPSLPFLIDHARNFAALAKLWLESTAGHIAPEEMDGDMLEFNELCANLQQRADECLSKAEGERLDDGFSAQAAELDTREGSIIQVVLQVVPEFQEQNWSGYRSLPIRKDSGPPGSSGSGTSNERKDRISVWEQTFGRERSQKSPDPHDSSQTSVSAKSEKPPRKFLGGLRRKGKESSPGPANRQEMDDKKNLYDLGLIC